MNAVIMTARAGSQSILHKNIYDICGTPCMAYGLRAAMDASLVDEVFVSTDGRDIASVAAQYGCTVLWQPPEVSGPEANHGDAIKWAVEKVDEIRRDLNIVVVLIGNTVMVDGPLIDRAIHALRQDPTLDSVMTVWKAVDDHPFRALEIDYDGCLRVYGGAEREVETRRETYPPAYFYDQGPWAFRKECVQHRDGPSPWWWMGERCKPIVREWIGGRDIHSMLDVAVAQWWIEKGRFVDT